MKKFISFLLAALMLVSAVPTTFATNDYTAGTKVEYTATGSESYTITVPAQLAPGGSGTVTLSGTWADNRIVTVTADPTVTLTNSIKAEDQKVLNVTFAGISEAGSNTGSQTFTEDVAVANIENALFGTWSGKFNYNVEVADVTSPYNGRCILCWGEDECFCDMEEGANLMHVVDAVSSIGVNSTNVQTTRNFLILNDEYFDSDDYSDMIRFCQEIHDLYLADYAYTYFQKSTSELTEAERYELWKNILPDEAKVEIYKERNDFCSAHGILITVDTDANGLPVYYYSIRE